MIAKKSDFVEILQGLFQVKDLKGKKFSLIAAKNIELIQDALTDLEDQGKPSEEFVELSIKMRALMESVEPDAKEKIKTLEEEIKTKSGLLLSAEDANQLRYKKGEIVKIGTDVTNIEEGKQIYYDKRAGHTMMIYDETYTIIQESDVVIVL